MTKTHLSEMSAADLVAVVQSPAPGEAKFCGWQCVCDLAIPVQEKGVLLLDFEQPLPWSFFLSADHALSKV